ncbi:hypothetical protein [Amycolatopsis samaneae]|uniref:Uncharacterized protein n=1 Tax=Amycolatopsis samaneae TaxID=664691 RepID=A0ABW5GWZ4_9PSEU
MEQPKFDLHTALAAMADYPVMLRRLGAIRIVEIDLAGTGIDLSAAGTVTVSATPAWTARIAPNPGEEPGKNLRVAPVAVPVHLAPSRFSLLANGHLDAAVEGLGIAEIDVDHAASRLLGLARQLVGAPPPGESAAPGAGAPLPERLSLPSLRNAGLSLTQTDRASKMRERLKTAGKVFSATEATKLDDPGHAVKGYLVDVWDDRTQRWHTLCARRGTYRLPGGRSFTADDEGAVSSAATARPDAGTGAMMYLHESMARWHGWSLVAPPVGKPVITEPEGSRPRPATTPALPGFDVTFVPRPGTLPVLRFGRGYRFRLRAVDVAGHADPFDPASTDFGGAVPAAGSPPAKHLRFDPVLAPVIVPTAPMTEGESIDTLVVRPDPGPGDVVSNLLAPILGTQPARHLAPPKVSVALVEEHGMVDTPSGKPDPAKYPMLAERDRADLSTVGTPDPRQPNQRYVGGGLRVSWLPDPICRGAVITGLPGGPAKSRFDPPLLGSWPDVQPTRVQLADGAAGWNLFLGVLTLFVPRGETRTVRLSSFVDADDVGLLGHVSWLTEAGASSTDLAAASADAQDGQAWQMTPPRTLTLVNAVRTPTTAPSLLTIGNDSAHPRALGSTTHSLVGNAEVHRPSTGLLALAATRTDPVDDPAAPAPTTVTTITRPPLRENSTTSTGQSPAIPVGYAPDPVTGSQVSFVASHLLGDTRRHQVSYTAEATTRYLEHFVQRGKVTFTGVTPLPLSSAGIVPGTAAVRSLDGKIAYRPDTDFVVDTQAGTITRTAAGAIPDGQPVEAAIVAPPVTRTGNAVTLDLPSTARPAPPRVAWVVPTFGWTDETSDLGLRRTRTRGGSGLRVFLERPWYSSGTGEQLAVILASAPVAAGDSQLLDLVTQLGTDPVVKTEALPATFPAIGQFPLAKDNRQGLTVPELAARGTAGVVAAAIHDVVWDAERRRWTCDIVLPPGRVYQPFAHLALARYQPNSLAGVELSAVAPLEWAQLAPDRAATVLLDVLDLTKVTVTVAGWSPSGTDSAKNRPNTVSVILQTTSSLLPGDLDWTTVGPADGQELTATGRPDGTTAWTGVLRLPKPRLLTPFRLVITERELYGAGGRLVYSDVIRI